MSLSHQLNIIRIVIAVPLARPIDVVMLDGPVEAVRPDSILAHKNVIACDISAKRTIVPVSGNSSGFVAPDVVDIVARDLWIVAVVIDVCTIGPGLRHVPTVDP